MGIQNLVDDNEVNKGQFTLNHSYTYFDDIVAAQYRSWQDNFNFSSAHDLNFETLSESKYKYEQLTGEKISVATDENLSIAYKKRYDKVIEQNRLQGLTEWNDIPTSFEAEQAAREKALQSGLNYDDAMSRAAPDAYKGLASFVGGMGAWLSDPMQTGSMLMTLPLSGGLATGIGARFSYQAGIKTVAGAEALLEMGLEAAIQPAVVDWQQKLGNDYDFYDAAQNVLIAGGASFGLSYGLLKFAQAKDFKGFTAEQITSIFNLNKKEILNESPRVMDAQGHLANKQNLASAVDDIQNRKIPDQVKFDETSSPRAFDEDAVTYEHGRVAKEFIESGLKKSDIDVFGRKAFIDEMIREQNLDSSLPAFDMDSLIKERSVIAGEVRKIKKQIVEMRKEANSLPDAEIDKKIELESNIAKMDAALESATKRKFAIDKKVETTKTKMNADQSLTKLLNNEIPESMEARYKTYNKNLKKALTRTEEAPVIAGEAFPPYGNAVPESTIKANLERAASGEADAVARADFERVVADSLTGGVSTPYKVLDESGNEIELSAADIMDEVKDNEAYDAALKDCIGAK